MKKPVFSYTRKQYDEMALTHDSSLPSWGPYSKILAGIAHVQNQERGAAYNFSAFPSVYRGRKQLPTEVLETNFHPWYASGDLSFYTYRFELEWKDALYCDVTYIRIADDRILVEADLHNNTDLDQQIGMHYLSTMQFPKTGKEFSRWVKPVCHGEASYADGVEYSEIRLAETDCRDSLVYDGRFLCEELCSDTVKGRALGGRFGKNRGDSVKYSLAQPTGAKILTVRAKGHGALSLGGDVSGMLKADSQCFETYTFPIRAAKERLTVTLTCEEEGDVLIDLISASVSPVSFVADEPYYVPQISEKGHTLTLDYGKDCTYAILWQGEDHMTRQVFGSEWESIMSNYVNNHVSTAFHGDGKEHFTDLHVRPIFLKPHTSKKIYTVICLDPTEEKLRELEALNAEEYAAEARKSLPEESDDPYAFSQRLMQATLLTNVVFPIYVQGKYIRHFTPGKMWNSLYTWDSGFIALGQTELDEHRALDTLNCYLTEVGNQHAAFIHHGSPVPVQVYVYKALWDKCLDKDYLESFYPRMKQYYEFLMGRLGSSTTRKLGSGLINTFDYFYNSGGWDDYPPQVTTHRLGISKTTCPAVNTVHTVVFAKILRKASQMLGLGDEEISERAVRELSEALQKYSWDGEAGYFSYVTHNEKGEPVGILRDENGVNHNMGLDGAEAILAGICTPEQERILANAIMDPEKMWTDCGISTVDKGAPYFRRDGYWNGAVWMPHQWFAFIAMLELCRTEDAIKIAKTGIETWKRETDSTYNCYEHFVLTSGRGGGWHHFGGLSSPVILWYKALFAKGTVTTPPFTFVTERDFSNDFTHARIKVSAAESLRGESSLLITLAEGEYSVCVNGKEQACKRFERAIAVKIKDGEDSVIEINKI